ncbi:hypothetical protein TrVE_jg3055 [Triparma verrucosa]|uniref:Endonuclease/exonuclease/phosphatase domain-containing protein n=1 Tax=Triparma verrucosa TaxID=1606542 RepID=A0A9W6Z4I6_9STRA|nr:hypothetical protein TrVE_jg3055 [Triparma verrucosa]
MNWISRDSIPPPPDPPLNGLKVVSVNMCVACAGMQNRILPTLCVVGGVCAGSILFGVLVVVVSQIFTSWQSIALVMLALLPIVALVGFVFGGLFGSYLGFVNTFFTGLHDFKSERLHGFSEALKGYDVLLIQELYITSPIKFDKRYDLQFIDLCKKYGFVYASKPAPRAWPSISMGTGLMILSKYPVVDSETLSFKNQYFAEQFGTNRGMLYAKVKVGEHLVDFFTLHTTASMGESLLKGFPDWLVNAADIAREGQFLEIGQWVRRRRTSPKAPLCVAGDFNANIRYNKNGDGSILDQRAAKIITTTMVDGLGLKDMGWRVTYGYSPPDLILTNPEAVKQGHLVGEDLIFIDPETSCGRNFRSIPWLANEEQRKVGFTHLSDHLSLAVDFYLEKEEK